MLFAALILQASVAAPVFAPPIDTPLRIVTERTETASDERRYRLERLVRFNSEAGGYRVEAILLGTTSAAPEALGNLVERGFAALEGRRIVLHVDDGGAVVAIDDMASLWERVCQRIAEAAATRRSLPAGEADALAARLVAPLRALPAERQRALLATLVTAAIMTDAGGPVGTVTPVKLPGTSPFGAPVTLEGTRRIADAGGGLTRIATLASAEVALPARDGAPARSGSVALERLRTFDPRTGIIIDGLDTIRNTTAERQTLLVTRLRIERAKASDWPH